MDAIYNILIVALVALIAYWWSSQGFLSGLLHMVCVICAGAIALAVWEPLIYDVASTGTWWDQLLPGILLLMTFAIVLTIMRMVTDRLAPENVTIPQLMDVLGGAATGAVSGIITVGLLVIGTGYIQRPLDFMNYRGWARLETGVVGEPTTPLWVPVDTMTTALYESLSLTTLHPDISGRPLAKWNPQINRQASLLRDTGHTEKRRTGQMMQPAGTVTMDPPLMWDPGDQDGYYLTIPISFTRNGLDFERSLLLSSAQVRLVGETSLGKTETFHPVAWRQAVDKDDTTGFYRFDSPSRYAASVNGLNEANLKLIFALPDDFQARFLQVRNLRLMMPETNIATGELDYFLRSGADGTGIEDGWGGNITSLVDSRARFHRSIRPTIDDFSGSFEIDRESKKLAKANFAKVKKSRKSTRGATSVTGYLSPGDNAVVLKIEVGPGTGASILAVARELGGDGNITLVDAENRPYEPVGYEMVSDRGATISFNQTIQRLSDIRARPRVGTEDQLYLIFVVPTDIRPVELMMDDQTVGFIEGIVTGRRR